MRENVILNSSSFLRIIYLISNAISESLLSKEHRNVIRWSADVNINFVMSVENNGLQLIITQIMILMVS